MSRTRVLYLILALGAAFWLVSRCGGGEEARIRRLLGEIEELVEKSAGEGALDGVGRARSFAALFAEPFVAEVAPAGQRIAERGQLMQVFVGFRHASETVALDYRGIEIALGESGREARVTFDAILNGGPSGMLAGEHFPVELFLRQVEGDWKIAEAKVGAAVR